MDHNGTPSGTRAWIGRIVKWGGGLFALFLVATFAVKAVPFLSQHAHTAIPKSGTFLKPSELVDVYVRAYHAVEAKLERLQAADEDNARLRLENATLRVAAETFKYGCKAEQAASATKQIGRKLTKETGDRVGRTLASIRYSPPEHLSGPQLVTLGESYFKGREDEKAAVIFTILTGLQESDLYKVPKYFLMTGISWYRLDNFELADLYFQKALDVPASTENLRFHAQARLWRSLAASRTGKNIKAQFWLRELLDHHPHSMEARWVNSGEVGRATASED